MSYDYRGYFGDITLTHDLTTRPEDRRWRLTPPPAEGEHHDVVLYLGCNVLRTSHMVRTVTAIFDRLGLDYVAVGGPTYCCGIQHHKQGDVASADVCVALVSGNPGTTSSGFFVGSTRGDNLCFDDGNGDAGDRVQIAVKRTTDKINGILFSFPVTLTSQATAKFEQ